MAASAIYASSALKNFLIPGVKWLISDRLQDASCLFWQVILAFFDVTPLFSCVWEEKGGGVG